MKSNLNKIRELQGKKESEINEIRVKYEKQITSLKERINMQEFNEKSLKAQMKQDKNDYKQELRENDRTINDLQLKLQKSSVDKDKNVEKLRNRIEKMEEKHHQDIKDLKGNSNVDIDKIKEEYESKLNDIKFLNEQDKISLNSQIRKLEEEVILLSEQEQSFQRDRDSEFENERVKVLDIRMTEINNKFADGMLESEKELAKLR
mmetsp:Transcript_16357/g.14274  ORF Transcript_16357/g.14274 Transcript_16357/m.14274 type:complete len:205 (-) Transcript_16357:1916-2530(-)